MENENQSWIAASNPPNRTIERVIAKNEDDELSEAFWMTNPKPGFYVVVPGGAREWPHVTHYISWPNAEVRRAAEDSDQPQDHNPQ